MRKNFKNIAILFTFVLSFVSPADGLAVQAKNNQENVNLQSETTEIPTDRIIVKYKDGTSASFAPSLAPQMNRVSAASATTLEYVRPMGEGDIHVLELSERLPVAEVEAITQQLEALPEVEYAEPDRIYTVALEPDDPAYELDFQWNLNSTWGINMPDAWEITQGSSNVVVAVVDTGYTEHPELDGRLLKEGGNVYGYDFISFAIDANDPDGRDEDPLDEGDWVTNDENDPGDPFAGCPVTNSTWHGTHVAGIIGAQTDNNADVAGIDWNAKILPVRVLGKCGGYVSDVVDGMRWAAGLTSVPANLHPANIINLSLGGPGVCTETEQDAITEIVEAGVVVVAAAGNSNINVSGYSPANCNGVISVAATDIDGEKASYSNFGEGIHISAPGGDFGEGLGILSTSNSGTTVPAEDALEEKIGTSMAAPHVSGVLALMFAVNPGLTPDQALQILENTAKPFPEDGTCTTSNCGEGIVDAAAAVSAAEAPDLIITDYELVELGTEIPITNPSPNEPFGIRIIVKNRGGTDTQNFYRSVYIDRDPLDEVWFEITSPEGCLHPIGADEGETDRGDYTKQTLLGEVPAGATDTNTIVEISDPETEGLPPEGLPAGNYQIWLYADPTCTVEGESFEGNNAYGPFNLNIGGFPSGPTDIDVTIGAISRGTYHLEPGENEVVKYALDGGPVVISSNNGVGVIASLNQWRRRPSTTVGWTGVAQTMALPVSLITNAYYFPRYDYSSPSALYNNLLIANVDTVSRDITITIGGVVRGTYTLAPSQSQYVNYPGVVGGPVVVSSEVGSQIVASLYELIRDPSLPGWNGQSEMMGLPASQLSDQYLIPLYFGAANPNTLNASLYISNVDTISTTVDVTIAGVSRGTYNLDPATSQVVKYALDGGPVVISSNNGANIVASLNQWRRRPSTTVGWTGVAQTMALPVSLITNAYYFPRYDYSSPSALYNNLLIANVDTVSRDITITIGGVVRGTYTLAPSQSQYVNYPGVVGGPVVVSSEVGSQIVASLYELIRDPSLPGWNGQSEMMGLPASQLSDQYLIPLYFGAANPNTLNASLYIAVP